MVLVNTPVLFNLVVPLEIIIVFITYCLLACEKFPCSSNWLVSMNIWKFGCTRCHHVALVLLQFNIVNFITWCGNVIHDMDDNNMVEPSQLIFQQCQLHWLNCVGQFVFQFFSDTQELLQEHYLYPVCTLNHIALLLCFVVRNVWIISRVNGGDESMAHLRRLILCSNENC